MGPIERLFDHPVVLVIVILLLGGLVYALLQKVLKLALVFALGVVALFGYFALTGQEPPPAMKRLEAEAKRHIERGLEVGAEKAREAGQKIGDEVKKATEKAIQDTVGGEHPDGSESGR